MPRQRAGRPYLTDPVRGQGLMVVQMDLVVRPYSPHIVILSEFGAKSSALCTCGHAVRRSAQCISFTNRANRCRIQSDMFQMGGICVGEQEVGNQAAPQRAP